MPRRREVEKRKILPDPKFQDRVVAKFVNNLMRKGKKSTGERIIYGAFDRRMRKSLGWLEPWRGQTLKKAESS